MLIAKHHQSQLRTRRRKYETKNDSDAYRRCCSNSYNSILVGIVHTFQPAWPTRCACIYFTVRLPSSSPQLSFLESTSSEETQWNANPQRNYRPYCHSMTNIQRCYALKLKWFWFIHFAIHQRRWCEEWQTKKNRVENGEWNCVPVSKWDNNLIYCR